MVLSAEIAVEDVVGYLLDGLEAALELERELGVRSIEVDRTLLTEKAAKVALPPCKASNPAGQPQRVPKSEAPKAPISRDLVFLHDRPLSPGADEMVKKIIVALGRTAENTPVIIAPPIPQAKLYVFLGFGALRKYMPALKIEENTWGKSPKGKDILVVKDPEEIVRFGTVTPVMQKIKQDMWRSLKAVKQRLVPGA